MHAAHAHLLAYALHVEVGIAKVLLENVAEAFEEWTLVSGSASGHDHVLGNLLVDNHLGEIKPVCQHHKDDDDCDDDDACHDDFLLQVDLREIEIELGIDGFEVGA